MTRQCSAPNPPSLMLMAEFGFTGPFCPDCLAHMVPLVRSPYDPVLVGHRCPNCDYQDTEDG